MNILSIGGSDPSSGAGVQSDIRAAAALGDHCFCVVTAITAQNSAKFIASEPVPAEMIKKQIEAILSDFAVDAVCIGMVYDSRSMRTIHSCLKGLKIPVIVDPVVKSTTGGSLLREGAVSELKKSILSIAHTVTPNAEEAKALSGMDIRGLEDLKAAARKIASFGPKNVVITGCELERGRISEVVFSAKRFHVISGKKVNIQNHGGGCNFAFALAHHIAAKSGVVEAARLAKEFSFLAIRHSESLGRGARITSPKRDAVLLDLEEAVARLQAMPKAHALIPEVQTNFAYSKPGAKTPEDVASVLGRIVKAGERVVVAGTIQYGGSRHVAAAVIAMQKRFPKVRSAINIRYDTELLKKLKRSGMKIKSYDRTKEPAVSKAEEGSSVAWGIEYAIRNSQEPPDAVCHTGDLGKEPMTIIFGSSPKDVLSKLKFLDS